MTAQRRTTPPYGGEAAQDCLISDHVTSNHVLAVHASSDIRIWRAKLPSPSDPGPGTTPHNLSAFVGRWARRNPPRRHIPARVGVSAATRIRHTHVSDPPHDAKDPS